MRRRSPLLTAALLIVVAAGSVATARDPHSTAVKPATPSDIVSQEIRRIVANLKHTKYQHPTRVDEAAGSYELDCSGLACYLLQRVLPEHYRSIHYPKRRSRAKAMDFQAYFAAAPTAPGGKDGWRRIERMLDARPGDILAWRSANPKTGSTGHVVIIDGLPTATPNGQVRVAVIDSTSSRHGSDTRAQGQNGIGRGLMWFAVDDEGRPVGYRWSRPDGKLRERPIAIGRAVAMTPDRAAAKRTTVDGSRETQPPGSPTVIQSLAR